MAGGIKIVDKNKRAHFDFFLFEKYEAGIVLKGVEVKSIRGGKAKIADAWIKVDSPGEVWIQNMYIAHYEFGNIHNELENRTRKLLLGKKEIAEIELEQKKQNYTIVPTKLYFKGSKVKIEIALGKGKQQHDKRHDQAKKDVERKLQRGQYE